MILRASSDLAFSSWITGRLVLSKVAVSGVTLATMESHALREVPINLCASVVSEDGGHLLDDRLAAIFF